MLADSHIHLFQNGYKNSGENEVSHYESLIKTYSINSALVVGFEGEPWALGNNAFIASQAKTRPWMHPLAFLHPERLNVNQLDSLLQLGFEGITLYLFTEKDEENLLCVEVAAWQWLVDHHWIVSVNSKGDCWKAWLKVLGRTPDLNLLISHLGLPTVSQSLAAPADIDAQLAAIRKIYEFKNVYLKLSGFYALEPTKPIYPYPTLDHYLQYILQNFEVERLIWASDFTPALSVVTFPQTFQHFSELPFLKPQDLSKILNQNLLNLLSRSTNPRVR
ncbi:unannotated protein [freshwater metagenome]|uniref:Unannotated protein n=1 Tax=freshwater metagenome TaxID=449393 RepID=A0A6J6VGN3_9ZZZZ|nr:amidohydrolase family protein [Actinomycetota bacterium]MSW26003.1 amidohydrolase family protein [Actinomycetota bacterium]MSW33862.1 amidohydrolase family protein [Actinomycetota bacterium]MSX30847.1 amidohydrolase family protein [Actinomycetota bacterium]MSX50815.1 amidohydrolase family protein [Actinomycetota bacterium]